MFLRCFILLVFVLSGFTRPLWANDEVQVSVSSKQVNIGESITLDIVFDPGISTGEIELSIPGIEEFSVFSESQRQESRIINGNAQTQFRYTLQLRSNLEGSFSVGPVQINLGDSILTDDESVVIQVGNDIDEVQEIAKEEAEAEIETKNEKPELRPLRGYEMSPGFIAFLIVLFFIIFFVLLRKYLNTKRNELPKTVKILPPTHIEKLKRYFRKLDEISPDLDSQEFYRRLNLGIREVFEIDAHDLTQAETLTELRKNKKIKTHSVFPVFEKSYLKEFSGEYSPPEDKTQYINAIIQHLNTLGK